MSGRTNNDVSAPAGASDTEIPSGGSDADMLEDTNPDELDAETLAVELAYWKLYRQAIARRCN